MRTYLYHLISISNHEAEKICMQCAVRYARCECNKYDKDFFELPFLFCLSRTMIVFTCTSPMVCAVLVNSGDATVDPMNNIAVGIVAALLGSSLGALSYVIVRSIGRQGEPPL